VPWVTLSMLLIENLAVVNESIEVGEEGFEEDDDK